MDIFSMVHSFIYDSVYFENNFNNHSNPWDNEVHAITQYPSSVIHTYVGKPWYNSEMRIYKGLRTYVVSL